MPRLTNFSSVNATIDHIKGVVGTFDKIVTKDISFSNQQLPYSLVVAVTESLPEEGDFFSTTAYCPYKFNVKSITLQVNQEIEKNTKVNVYIGNKVHNFMVSKTTPTLNINTQLLLQSYINVKIENMKDDDGDISSCSVILHGTVIC